MKLDLVIAGVGGQGTVLASRILAQAALNAGYAARTSEMIGMAQREGSVQSHVRIAGRGGPVIGAKTADVLIGFEPAEAQRGCGLLRDDGLMLVNTQAVRPVTVALGSCRYPEAEVLEYLRRFPARTTLVDASGLAVRAGNFRTVNAVMLGMLAGTGILPFGSDEVLQVLLEMVPAKAREVNERAYQLGMDAL
jgi:indolepyruvate ferredoxin oxidoreductase beta subunit